MDFSREFYDNCVIRTCPPQHIEIAPGEPGAFLLAATAVVVAAAAIAATAAVGGHQTVIAAAAEQNQQDNDPPAAIPTKTIVTHKPYLLERLAAFAAHSKIFCRQKIVKNLPGGIFCG